MAVVERGGSTVITFVFVYLSICRMTAGKTDNCELASTVCRSEKVCKLYVVVLPAVDGIRKDRKSGVRPFCIL